MRFFTSILIQQRYLDNHWKTFFHEYVTFITWLLGIAFREWCRNSIEKRIKKKRNLKSLKILKINFVHFLQLSPIWKEILIFLKEVFCLKEIYQKFAENQSLVFWIYLGFTRVVCWGFTVKYYSKEFSTSIFGFSISLQTLC